MQGRGWILISSALVAFWACSAPQWKVRDLDGQVVQMEDPRFAPSEMVALQVGSISREISANQIEWLELDPSRVHSMDGRVFYGARLRLLDGSRYPEGDAADTVRGVFLGTDGRLEGRASTGLVSVPIAHIREFGRLLYFQNRDTVAHKVAVPKDTLATVVDSTAKAKPAPADTVKPVKATP